MVTVTFEIDRVAVGSRIVRTQATEYDGARAVAGKAVAGGLHVDRRVDRPVVYEQPPLLVAPGSILLHPRVNSSSGGPLKVADSHPLGYPERVLKKIVIDDFDLDRLTRGRRTEIEYIKSSSAASRCNMGDSDVCSAGGLKSRIYIGLAESGVTNR